MVVAHDPIAQYSRMSRLHSIRAHNPQPGRRSFRVGSTVSDIHRPGNIEIASFIEHIEPRTNKHARALIDDDGENRLFT
jgi:hypothetical protein